jgi:hypothetical protein
LAIAICSRLGICADDNIATSGGDVEARAISDENVLTTCGGTHTSTNTDRDIADSRSQLL